MASNSREIPEPYNVNTETAPLKPYFTKPFQDAIKSGLKIAGDTVTAIEKCVGASDLVPDLERLLNDAKRLSVFQSSDNRTIAVLGDSGEGNMSNL
jgi:hypothetical protein